MLRPDSQPLIAFEATKPVKSLLTSFEGSQTNRHAELEEYLN